MVKIFISYARESEALAKNLVGDLEMPLVLGISLGAFSGASLGEIVRRRQRRRR